MGMKRVMFPSPGLGTAALALAALTACTTREVPARYPQSMPAAPEAAAPPAPAVATALLDEPAGGAPPPETPDAPAHDHSHGGHHAH